MISTLRTILVALAAVMVLAATAFAEDTLVLKDGREFKGELIKEADGMVFFTVKIGSVEQQQSFLADEVAEIRVAEAKPEPMLRKAETADIPDNATKIAFLRLGDQNAGWDMVGPFLNGNAMMRSADLLRELPDEQKPDIVVLHIDSGGGAVAEIEDIMTAINDDLKKDFRVVAWIESAISGAAFTAMNVEELYFMTSGHLGGNVAFSMGSGGATAMDGQGLEWILGIGEEVSRQGRLNPYIMRSMQIFGTLTADVREGPNGNKEVKWYWAPEGVDYKELPHGEIMVSPEDKILTLNSLDALRLGVSKGTADTKQELAEAMGCVEWVEVGQEANDYQTEFREKVGRAQTRLNTAFREMQIALGWADGAPSNRITGANLAKAQRKLAEIRRLARNAPSMKKYWGGFSQFGGFEQFFDYWEEVMDNVRERARG